MATTTQNATSKAKRRRGLREKTVSSRFASDAHRHVKTAQAMLMKVRPAKS
jgi:hypothetical protein